MKHQFRVSENFKYRVESAISERLTDIDFRRQGNEPNYNPAFVQALHNIEVQSGDEYLKIEGTSVIGSGPNAAETWSGADMAITASISDGSLSVRKAVLVQAKMGKVEDLANSERARLEDQIRKMRRFNRAPKVLEISNLNAMPTIVSGCGVLEGETLRPFRFDRWFSSMMLPTRHGDTRKEFVEAVQDAQLSILRVKAVLLSGRH